MNSFLSSTSAAIVFLAFILLAFSAVGGWVLEKRDLRFFGLAYAITVIVLSPSLWALSSLTYLKEDAWTTSALGLWLLWTAAVLIPSALTLILIRRWKIHFLFRTIAATVAGTVVVPVAPYALVIVGCTIVRECI